MFTSRKRNCNHYECGLQQMPFYVYLFQDMDIWVLDPAHLLMLQIMKRDMRNVPNEDDAARANRHQAYRNYIHFMFGRLHQGDRKVIPSCFVRRIRDPLPSENNVYRGFDPTISVV